MNRSQKRQQQKQTKAIYTKEIDFVLDIDKEKYEPSPDMPLLEKVSYTDEQVFIKENILAYARKLIPGEFHPVSKIKEQKYACVLVVSIEPGTRVRIPMKKLGTNYCISKSQKENLDLLIDTKLILNHFEEIVFS